MRVQIAPINAMPKVTTAVEPSAAGACTVADFSTGSSSVHTVVRVVSTVDVDSAAHLRLPLALQTISADVVAPF